MSISISNITLSSNFNLTNTSGITTMLRDFKINGRYIDKIYWCDPTLFKNQPDNCGLIYKRYSNIIPIILSGQVFDILSNIGLDNATITLDRLYTRIPSSWVVSSYSLDEYGEDPGYYYIPSIYGNNTYKVTVQRRGYATYIDTGYSLKTHDTIQNFYINPIDESISRILLYWNQTPADLDLFVICPDGNQLSVKNDKNAFGYVNVTQNNQYGPEIISLNTYVNFDNPLKVGGTFDIYGRWVSDNGASMNSEIKMFTQQFGVQTFKNDPMVDNINRSKQFWNAAKLHVKSGIDSIQLSNDDLITYTVPLNLDVLEQLGTQISYYTPNQYDYYYNYYDGVIENTIDNNQIILYENAIFYLLKDYPFLTKLMSASGQITNYTTNITDNYAVSSTYTSRNAYSAYINFSNFNIKNSNVSAYFYLNETMKNSDQPFVVVSGKNITNILSINVRDIFYNKSIPLIILDSENKPLKHFQYRYTNEINSWGYYYRQRYIIKKHLSQNQYFLIKNLLRNNCKLKFTLGVQKQISISDLISNNNAPIPSSFTNLSPFIYHNSNELDKFKIKINKENNKIFLYGSLQHYNQRFFNQQWISNCNNFYDYYEDSGGEDYGYDYDGYNFTNKLNDFYLYNYYYNFNDNLFFTNNKRRTSFIEQKDEYKIHILNYNNYVSGMTVPLSSINVQYINKEVTNVKATAGNKYLKFEDMAINDTYLIDSISSAINGKLNYTYQWNPNGANISFAENAPQGQNCIFTFKRLYYQIPRQELYGMYQPKVYIKNKNNLAETLKYGVTFAQNTLITDFYEQISGITNGFDYTFIDFNRMYKLKAELVDNYTANFDLTINFNKNGDIKQYIGYKILVWQNNSSKIIRSYEGMCKDNIKINCPQLISNNNYKVDIYAMYRRYHGNLSGIYRDGYQNYTYRDYYDGNDYYTEYSKREFTQNIFQLDSFITNVAGSGISLTKNYTLPYGQFRGTIYTVDGKQLINDLDGIAILKHEDFDIEYNCAWKNSTIWSIDYIYPGTYYFQVKYSNKLIYSEYIVINKDNIVDTTNKKFYSSAGFKSLIVNIFNQQTNQLALHPQPPVSTMYYENYHDFDYKLRVLTKQNLLQDNTISSLTKEIKYLSTRSREDQNITNQAYIDSIYSFALSAADYKSIPISKLTHGSQSINATIDNNSALIYISDATLKSNQTISIWAPYWYWRSFEIYMDTYTEYRYWYYFNGLSIDMYDQNNQLVPIANNPYITKYYISDIDKICEYSAWKQPGMYDYYSSSYWYTDDYKKYQKTGQYKLKYMKKFGNSDKNTNVLLTEDTINIYDNGYYDSLPNNFPYKYIKIKPTFINDQNGLSGNLYTTSFKASNKTNIASSNDVNGISSLLSSNLYGHDNQISGVSYSYTLSCMFYGNISALSGNIYYRLNNNEILSGIIEKNNINVNNNKFTYNLNANLKNKNNTSSCSITATLAGILLNGINCTIPNNTFLSIPVFCGNSENISDYEIADYYAVYHNMIDYPAWTDQYYGGYDSTTENIYIIDQINYWIGAFNIFNVGNASEPLNIIGLYPSDRYTNNMFIQQSTQSIGYQKKCGQYNGVAVDGNTLEHRTEYIMLLGNTSKISVGGYIRDNNNREWTSIAFDINVYNENDLNNPIVQLKNIKNERFDLGLLDKGIYKIEMFIANTSINVLNPEDSIKIWNQSTTHSTLFRTSINRAYLESQHCYKLNNTNNNVPTNRIALQLQLLDNDLKYYSQVYTNNQGSWYYHYNLIAGKYKIKYKWNLTTIKLSKSDLNINGNKFSISQDKLKSYIPSSYKQPVGQLCLGTILDSNNNIAYYNSSTNNNILSGQFINSNISLSDSIEVCLCQQEAVSSITLSPENNSITHIFDYAWGNNISKYEFRYIPSNFNNKIICKSADELISLSANGTKLSSNDIWIKCGTQLNLTMYHDQIKIGEATTTYYNNENRDFNYNYPTANVSANFIDKITNTKLEMNYSYQYDDGTNLTRNMFVYHTNCEQNINQTSGQILKNNIYYNYKSTNSINESPVISENLYTNESYLITYVLGNDGQLSASTMITNLSSTGLTKTFTMPYGCIRMGRFFRDKNNNSNSINASYASLTLIRQQNDGHDITYTYDGSNSSQNQHDYYQHIRTGLYKIKLQSNIPGKMPVTIQYQKLNMLSGNFDMINYINTNPAIINCSIIKQSNINMPLTVRIWHNNLIYAERSYTNSTSNIDLSLFNIPFELDIIDSNNNIVAIKGFSLGKSNGTSYEINNNKISFETSNKTEDFIITI